MSFIIDQKSRYLSAGLHALREGNFREASEQIGKAARCALRLSESTDGPIAKAHLAEAQELIERGQRIQQIGKKMEPQHVRSSAGSVVSSSKQNKTGTSKTSQFILTEKPTVRFQDVAGLEEVKRIVQEDIIQSIQHPEIDRELKIPPGSGALMYGPPGNGKTLIARAIAGELDAPFLYPLPSQVKSKYQGIAPKIMRALFEEASKHECAVIFIDEIHDILGKKDSAAINEFLILTEGIDERRNNLLLLGATNFPWKVNIAIAGRLKNQVYIGMPDSAVRKKIFELQFDGVRHAEDFPFNEFAASSEPFSGRDIKAICTSAKRTAKKRVIEGKEKEAQVLKEDVFGAIKTKIPSVQPKTIEAYQKWNLSMGAPEF